MNDYAGPVYDAHLHIVDPRFPLVENEDYLPQSYVVADYMAASVPLGITGGTIVSGSFQAFDQTYLLSALAALGPSFTGVTQIPASTLDHEILALDAAGVRAVRFTSIATARTPSPRSRPLRGASIACAAGISSFTPILENCDRPRSMCLPGSRRSSSSIWA